MWRPASAMARRRRRRRRPRARARRRRVTSRRGCGAAARRSPRRSRASRGSRGCRSGRPGLARRSSCGRSRPRCRRRRGTACRRSPGPRRCRCTLRYTSSTPPGRRPRSHSASAPRFASLSTGRARRGARLIRSAACIAGPARQDRRRADVPVCGGSARGGPSRRRGGGPRPRRTPRRTVSHELGRLLDAGVGVVVVRHLAPRLGEDLVGEVRERDGEVALAEVDADRDAGRGRARSASAGARRWRRRAVGVAVDDDALGLEAATIVETVERDSPVRRARCARLVTPRSWSAWMTRSPLDARRTGRSPARPPSRRPPKPRTGLSRIPTKSAMNLVLISPNPAYTSHPADG